MMTLREVIQFNSKQTVGYSEANDKQSFNVGVDVSFSIASKHYEKIIEELKRKVEHYRSSYEQVNKDITTLSSIINRYKP